IACLLKRYSLRFSSPARSWKFVGARKAKCSPFLVQIEQLHAVTMARSLVASNRTWPQWQPPVKVLGVAIVSSLLLPSFKAFSGKLATLIFAQREEGRWIRPIDPPAFPVRAAAEAAASAESRRHRRQRRRRSGQSSWIRSPAARLPGLAGLTARYLKYSPGGSSVYRGQLGAARPMHHESSR